MQPGTQPPSFRIAPSFSLGGENTAVFTFPTPSSILKYYLFANESQGQVTELSAHLFSFPNTIFLVEFWLGAASVGDTITHVPSEWNLISLPS